MSPIIEVNHLSKRYQLGTIGAGSLRNELEALWMRMSGVHPITSKKEFWALKDVSFSVDQGEVLGVIGRNGAGKSTLLKLLSRITEPTEGDAKLRGRVASLLEVGTGFHPELSGRENIFLNGTLLGMRRHEVNQKFDQIVEFAGIGELLDTPVKRYSSGMHVRLGFAVAAHLEPEILIVDEVLAVGDAEFQRRCIGKMKEVSKGGRTVLFVSHNMSAVNSLCSRGILLHRGILDYQGSAQECVTRYLSHQEHAWKDADGIEGSFFRNLRTIDSCGKPCLQFEAGVDITLSFIFKFPKSGDHHPQFGIGINNEAGVRVTTLRSDFCCHDLHPLRDGEEVRCKIPDSRFAPGRYFVRLFVENLEGEFRMEDDLPLFMVTPSAFYESGFVTASAHGTVVSRQHWLKL